MAEEILIAEYKFNNSTDTLPTFNHGNNYTYTYEDVVEGEITTRTIYSDSLPTTVNFISSSITELIYLNISNITNFTDMFHDCNDLVTVNASDWDTSRVTNMCSMFNYCHRLTNIDVSNWDTSNVTDMSYMFSNCSFNLTSLDVSNWDTSSVTDMNYMFQDCTNLITLDVSNWDTSSVTNMYAMFYQCTNLTTLDVSNFNTSSVTDMGYMFVGCNALTSLDVSNWDTSSVTNMYIMFSDCTNLTTLDLSNWDTSNITDMSYMFYQCSSLASLDLSNFDTSSVTDMNAMFYRCTNLTSIDVSNFDTSEVTNMHRMFWKCNALTSIDVSNWDTSSVTDMSRMFQDCFNLTSLDVSNWDTSNVTDMNYMFHGCNKITQLDVSNWDTRSVTNMHKMFSECQSLTTIDVSNFDTSNVTDIHKMFYQCTNLTSIDVSNFDTSEVTDMSDMFNECNALTTLDVSNFNTSNVTDMHKMFYNCTNLKSIDISNFDTSNVTDMSEMFNECNALTTINMNNSDIDSINDIITELPTRTTDSMGTLNIAGIDDISQVDITTVNSKYWNMSTDLPPDESEDNLLTLNKANETINIKQEKELTAICEQNVLWSVNNDNIAIEALNNISNVVLYGQVATVELKNCEIAQTINSFNVVSYTSSEVTVKFRIFNLDPNETYTFSMSYLSGTSIEIYYGDEYQSGSTSETYNLTGSDSYTFVFYRRNGTTENWGLSNLLLVDSSGNDNMDSFSSKTIRIIGRSKGTSIITCTTEDGTLSDTCTVTVTNFTGYNLGSERGLYSWKDENLLSNTLLFNTINTLNITELYQSIDGEYFENNANIINEFINTVKSNTNLKVYYLNGDPSWYAKYDSIKTRIDYVLNFNANNAYNATIDGIVLDIEPWSDSSIKETDWSATYLNTMSQVYNYCQTNSIELQLIVPYWLDTNSMFENYPDFYKSVIDNCDTIQIMNFNKSGVVKNIKNEIEYAISKNKKIVSIAECNPVNDEHGVTESLTFYNDGIDAVHESWLSIYNTYEYDNLCFAYHDFHNAITGWINEGLLSVKISNEIRLENLEINDMYIGEDEIKEVYLGDILLYKKH